MAKKPVSMLVGISDESGDYRAEVTADGALKVDGSGAGGGPVTIADGADVALGATTDDAYTGTDPYTAMSALRAIANAAISTDPVPVGGIYSTTLPTYASGDSTQAQFGLRGALDVQLYRADSATPISSIGTGMDAVSNGINGVNVQSFPVLWNGAAWDRQRMNPAASGGAALVEQGPYTFGRVTADGQIKGSAGFIHTITITPTGVVTAGTVTIYNSLTESGTIVVSIALPATTFTPFSVTLDVACSTGIFVGFDGALANVSVTVSYR